MKDIHNDTRGIMLTIDARGSHGYKEILAQIVRDQT